MFDLTYDESKVTELLAVPESAASLADNLTFWYGGWSLNELRKMRPDLFYDQSWYDREPFANAKGETGIYTVTFRVPGSDRKTFAEQQSLLKDGESVAPVAIAATAHLLILAQGGPDPLHGDFARCAEQSSGDFRV